MWTEEARSGSGVQPSLAAQTSDAGENGQVAEVHGASPAGSGPRIGSEGAGPAAGAETAGPGPGGADGHLRAVPLPEAAAGDDRAAAGGAADRAGPAAGPQPPAGTGLPRARRGPAAGPAGGVRGGAAAAAPSGWPRVGTRRAVVGMLTGCVQSVFFPQVNAATARVLAAEGCDVVIPRGQGCCGALSLALGPGGRGDRLRPAHHRHLRAGRGGRDRGQLGRLRLGHEGVRAAAGRRPTAAGPGARPR